jgi:hypothetical protein
MICQFVITISTWEGQSPRLYRQSGFLPVDELDFIQLRGIDHRVHKAFEANPRDLHHVGLLLRCGKMDVIPQIPPYKAMASENVGSLLAYQAVLRTPLVPFSISRCAVKVMIE